MGPSIEYESSHGKRPHEPLERTRSFPDGPDEVVLILPSDHRIDPERPRRRPGVGQGLFGAVAPPPKVFSTTAGAPVVWA